MKKDADVVMMNTYSDSDLGYDVVDHDIYPYLENILAAWSHPTVDLPDGGRDYVSGENTESTRPTCIQQRIALKRDVCVASVGHGGTLR